jgi:hypothetical protein
MLKANFLAALKIECGKPESSLAVDIELTLQKYCISSSAYHGEDFQRGLLLLSV